MIVNPNSEDRVYEYFLDEASELLRTIEETLLNLLEEKTPEKVHVLMRSAHTLKGSAANVQQETIETIAHHLEDVFEALYPAELEIDPELSALLLEGYECLRTPLSAILLNSSYDQAAVLDRTASVFAQLQAKLGDFFGREAPLPTSEELGFDVVGSIFSNSVPNDLEQLETIVSSGDPEQIREVLTSQAGFFLDLGSSYNLPGLEEIGRATIAALEQQPEKVLEIATAALDNFRASCDAVVAGDRDRGGEVSTQLRDWAGLDTAVSSPIEAEAVPEMSVLLPSEEEESTLTIEVTSSSDESVGISPADMSELNPSEASATESENSSLVISTSSTENDSIEVRPTSDSELSPSLFSQKSEQITPQITEAIDYIGNNSQTAICPVDRLLQSISIKEQPATPSFESQKTQTDARSGSNTQSKASPTVRVAIEHLDNLSHSIGELLVKENQQNLQSDRIHNLARKAKQQFFECQKQLFHICDSSNKDRSFAKKSSNLQGRLLKIGIKGHSKNISHFSNLSVPVSSNQTNSQFDSLEMDSYSELHIQLQNLSETLMVLGEQIEAIEGISQQSHLNLGKRKQLLNQAQENLFEARMVPLVTVLNRLPRLLQQMVATHDKKAELQLQGSNVLVDKAISEKLYESLLHLIRNAYDHGLESPDVRAQNGKPETGKISIRAYNQGNFTTIDLSDDGQGLNWERIRAKAIDKQLLDPQQAASASEAELAEVLFQPGFSTAEKITDLSGRGVGLDVVRSQLQAFKGNISVRSHSGKGTTFVLQLPLSLTTASLLLCESHGITYAIFSEAISQIFVPQPDRIETQQSITGQGLQKFLRWGEEGKSQKLIPIRPLADLMSYQHSIIPQDRSSLVSSFPIKQRNQVDPLLILQIGERHLCLQVDRILAEQELVIKSFESIVPLPTYTQGYSILGDGSLTLVIDPVELVRQAWERTLTLSYAPKKLPGQSLLALKPEQTLDDRLSLNASQQRQLPATNSIDVSLGSLESRPLVLVVDDSVVQRQSVISTLEQAGYRILEAGNGQEAIDKLNKHPDINLVICDIEMPRMNGFEFLGQCRQNPRFSDIPVVMLTTRSGQKHRRFALALGAKSYLTKPYSNRGILETVTELIEGQENKN
ncbi:MAG: response regulator [Prochloraceae cyanobacterium]|nr:response regulator [Prochloraceae cyanobacterium]